MSDRSLRISAAFVALAGASIAAYLTWIHYSGTRAVCIAGGGCETVQSSSYATLGGVPVALLGLIAYSAVVVLIAWDSPGARLGAAAIALAAVVFSAYLLALQIFVIDAFCVWCLANDVVVAPALAVLTALRLRS